MEFTFLQMIILYCLHKINGERTIYSIYHLLHGKKSSQTIQDAYLFHLTPFFHTYPTISRQEIESIITKFATNEWIHADSNQHYLVTDLGEKILFHAVKNNPIPANLNGMKYQSQAILFWERLSLMIQVFSYLQHRESRYMPVQRRPETISWIRDLLKQNKSTRENLCANLYSELVSCLDHEPSIDPNVFVIRLSGYRSIGLTFEQASQKLNIETTQYYYQFLNVLHFMIDVLENNAHQYPLLSSLLEPSQKENLTQSTEKTFQLLNQGYSIADIVNTRQLKKGTIEDHIVELALKISDFSIEPFVTVEKQNQIKKVVNETMTKQLRLIQNKVQDATYFEIRLVLAKDGDR